MPEGRLHVGEVYVWWAKIFSPNRAEPLPHLAEVLQVAVELAYFGGSVLR